MKESELREKMADRLMALQTPWGRFRINSYIKWKRFAWNMVTGFAHATKRLFDIVISIMAIVILAPVFLVIALLVKLDGGPVFFGQIRYGLHGREFKMLKFRSMVQDAEARLGELLKKNEKKEGITFKMQNDPRITRIGRIIRKTSLDELPQFWNVLCGQMSIVGPRPPVRREVELYEQRHRRRFNVKPGITCLWQVGEREGREVRDRRPQLDRFRRAGSPRRSLYRESVPEKGHLVAPQNGARNPVW